MAIHRYSTAINTINLSEACPIKFGNDHLELLQLGFCMTCYFFFNYLRAPKRLVEMNPPANMCNARVNRARFPLYLNKPPSL